MTLMKFYKRKSFDASCNISISLQSEIQCRKAKEGTFPLLCQIWKCCLCYLLPCIVVTRPLGGVLLSAAIFFHFTQFWDRWLRKKELQMNLILCRNEHSLYWTFNSSPVLSPLSCPHPYLPALLLLYRQWRRLIRNDKSYISSQTREHVTKATFLN